MITRVHTPVLYILIYMYPIGFAPLLITLCKFNPINYVTNKSLLLYSDKKTKTDLPIQLYQKKINIENIGIQVFTFPTN